MSPELTIPLFVALPLSAAFLIPLLGLIWKRIAEILALAVTAVSVLLAVGRIGAQTVVYAVGGWDPPFGINMYGDALSGMLHLIIALVSLLVIIYSLSYMNRYTASVRFYCLLMLMIAGMNGVIASGDLFNIFVFLEIASISSYALVAFGVEREELEASFKYLVLGGIASSLILFGIALLYSVTGTLNLADNARVIASGDAPMVMMRFVSALFLMGFGLKAALVPFHAWLPDAHSSAPAPISAMLSGLLIKMIGVYCIMRVFFLVFGADPVYSAVLLTLGAISMIAGALLAIGQDDIKRMLAYSSISQMGYIVLGLGLGTPLGVLGGLLHLLNHAFFKSLLFLCAGSIEYSTRSRSLKDMGGLWKKMPFTGFSCMIASLSISGIPPLGGFFSKLIIIIATVKAAETIGPVAYLLAVIAVVVGFITLAYFVKLQKLALFGETQARMADISEAPASMWSVLVILAVICIGLGVFCPWMLNELAGPARTALFDAGGYISQVLGY